jgi:hypothetical protein
MNGILVWLYLSLFILLTNFGGNIDNSARALSQQPWSTSNIGFFGFWWSSAEYVLPPGAVQWDAQVLMFSEFSVIRRMVIQFGIFRD